MRLQGSFVCLLVVLVLLGCLPIGSAAPVEENKLLDVKLFAQQTDLWCWAAGAEMIMDYHEKSVSQCVHAGKAFGRDYCCQHYNDCSRPFDPVFEKFDYNVFFTRKGALLWKDLAAQIMGENPKPVGFSWKWVGGGGHYMVARGLITIDGIHMLVVNDPSPSNPDKCKGGKILVMTYDDYVSFSPCYTHEYTSYEITMTPRIQRVKMENNGAPASVLTTGPVSFSRIREQQLAAAREGLRVLKQFPMKFAALLGFKSKKQLLESTLDPGKFYDDYFLPVSFIEEKVVKPPDKHIESVLGYLFGVKACVLHQGKVITTITVRKRTNGRWSFALFGEVVPTELSRRELDGLSPEPGKEFFIVEVPAYYKSFWGYYHQPELKSRRRSLHFVTSDEVTVAGIDRLPRSPYSINAGEFIKQLKVYNKLMPLTPKKRREQ